MGSRCVKIPPSVLVTSKFTHKQEPSTLLILLTFSQNELTSTLSKIKIFRQRCVLVWLTVFSSYANGISLLVALTVLFVKLLISLTLFEIIFISI